MRVKHALRGPASRTATVVWEEQCPGAAWRCLRCLLVAHGYIAQVLVLRDPSVARQRNGRIRVNHGLRAPGGWIRHQIWEEQGPNLRTSRRKPLRGLLGRLLSVGYPNAQVHDPFRVPRDAHPGKGKSQVVGGELKAQVVGGEAKVGRGHDRDPKRNRTNVKILPILWFSPALTSTLLAMLAFALPEPSAVLTELRIPLGSLEP